LLSGNTYWDGMNSTNPDRSTSCTSSQTPT
jgi:hypothetical protein